MLTEVEYDQFLELLYSTAVEPDAWDHVISQLADLIGGAKAWMPDLHLANGSGKGRLARIDPEFQVSYFQHFAARNPFVPLGDLGPWPLGVLTDDDYFRKEDFIRTEYYNDFLKPQDIHSTVVMRLARIDGVQSTINVTRSKRRDRFTDDDLRSARRLHPHLVRAFNLGRRFASLGAFSEGLVETVARSAHGIILIDERGRLRYANSAAERLIAQGDSLQVIGGRLGAWIGDADRQLGALIARALGFDGAAPTAGAMALVAPSRRRPLSITVSPLRSERLLGSTTPAVMVSVVDTETSARPSEQVLRALFGLTRAEVRVALAIFEGCTAREIGARFGLSLNTIRVQTASILRKTGTRRQSELVRLIAESQ